MGIFDHFLGTPQWAASLLKEIRPSRKEIAAIEKVRCEYAFSHEDITFFVLGHRTTTRRVLRHACQAIRSQARHLPDQDVQVEALKQRVLSGCALPLQMPSLLGLTPDSSDSDFARVVVEYSDIDQLADAVTAEEYAHAHVPVMPGYEDAERRLDDILLGH